MNRGALRALAVVSLALVAAAGCDGRARAIKAELSPAEVRLFEQGRRAAAGCWACHDIYDTNNKIGPYLSGVFGRPAGSARGFAYSEVLRSSGVVWDDRSLRAFLADVPGYLPGNRMVAPSIRSSQDLQAIVFYLEHATRPVRGG